jgi:hypothetical protein
VHPRSLEPADPRPADGIFPTEKRHQAEAVLQNSKHRPFYQFSLFSHVERTFQRFCGPALTGLSLQTGLRPKETSPSRRSSLQRRRPSTTPSCTSTPGCRTSRTGSSMLGVRAFPHFALFLRKHLTGSSDRLLPCHCGVLSCSCNLAVVTDGMCKNGGDAFSHWVLLQPSASGDLSTYTAGSSPKQHLAQVCTEPPSHQLHKVLLAL